jgi:cytochrome c5
MRLKNLLCSLLVLSLFFATAAAGRSGKQKAVAPAPAQNAMTDDEMRVEGEKRFQTNCGRCHQSPHKFPPRMMLTIERHMRVRALITDEDLRLIVRYMSQ